MSMDGLRNPNGKYWSEGYVIVTRRGSALLRSMGGLRKLHGEYWSEGY